MSVQIVSAGNVQVEVFNTADAITRWFCGDEDFADVTHPALLLESRLVHSGIVIPGTHAELVALHDRIATALGLPDLRHCVWCEEAQAPAYLAHEGHDPDCPLQEAP